MSTRSSRPPATSRRTTRPLGPRNHYAQLTTDELARVYGWRQDERQAEQRADRRRWAILYAGLGILMLALVLAIVVLARS
jgi:hypothetical protein